ncbi:galanin receptor type 2-like [Glandiceps talaboti]
MLSSENGSLNANATEGRNGVQTDVSTIPWLNILLGCTGILGLLGNALVCVVFIRVRELRTLTNHLIVHQAIIDLLTSFMIVLYYLGPQFTFTANNIGGEILCRIWKSAYLMWTCFLASSFNLVVITLERFCAIVYPLHHVSIFTDTRVMVILAFEWVFALAVKSFNLYVQHFDQGHCTSARKWPSPEFGRFVGIANVFGMYLAPLLVMAVSYAKCILVLKKTSSAVHAGPNQPQGNNQKHSLRRAGQNVLKMLIMVSLAYALCWGPNQILFLAFGMGLKINFSGSFYRASVILGFINSSVNPFIYALKYKQFQRGLRAVFCKYNGNLLEDSHGSSGANNDTARNRQARTNIEAIPIQ